MARSFASATDKIIQGTVAAPVTGSLSLWLYPNWAWNDTVDHYIFDVSLDASNVFQLRKFSFDNNFYCGWYTADIDYRVTTAASDLVQSAWNHLCLTWDDTANETKLFLAGSQIGSTVVTLVTFTSTSNRVLGNDSLIGLTNLDGRLGEYAVWDAVLNLNEIVGLSRGQSPWRVRNGSLTDYLRLDGLVSPEPNMKAGRTEGTVTGATLANHAPVPPFSRLFWGASPVIEAAAAAGGGFKPYYDRGSTMLGLGARRRM